MFKKLVSNLPFNPSLIEHFPEYKASLKKERNLRIVGFSILTVAFLGQIFIAFAPPQPKLTYSPNDLISGGFNTQNEAVADCHNQYQEILSYYSINCADVRTASKTTIRLTSYSKHLYSLNRLDYGQSPENLIKISNQTYYLRPLWAGSALASIKLKALTGFSNKGVKFFILYDSGNLVLINPPIINNICNPNGRQSCPKLFITARDGQINNVNDITVKPSDTIIYTLSATNLSKETINNFVIGTNFSSAFTYSNLTNLYGGEINDNFVYWPRTSIQPNQTITKSVSFKVKNPVPQIPLSFSDSSYYNMKMTTVYGNVINIQLPWSFSKYFELEINNTMPTQTKFVSLVISLLLLIFVGYFLARNLLILRELEHVKKDYLNGGGSK